MKAETARRYILTGCAFIFITCLFGGWLQANVQEWAKANGQDQYLVKYAGPIMASLMEVIQSPVFVAVAWSVIGGSIFLWIDYVLRKRTPKSKPGAAASSENTFYPPTVTQSPPTLAAGLYIGEIRLTLNDLKKNRRSELTMRVFNGTGRKIEFDKMTGQIAFNAPNNTDPARKGVLPPPTLRHDVTKASHPLQEWFFIFEQRVPAEEADKLLEMLRSNVTILFELGGLEILVYPSGRPKEAERMPLWHGFSYRKDFGFGRIIAGTVYASARADTTLG